MARGSGLATVSRESMATQAAREIRDAILSGRLPNGAPLREQTLAAELGLSRGPVREALQRLIQEGLAIGEPHRGVFVTQLTEQELADVFVARLAVEETAAVIIATRDDGQWARDMERLRTLLHHLRDVASTGTWAQITDADVRFHQTLVAMSRSARLQRGFLTLSAETRIGIMRQERKYDEQLSIVPEHEQIVQAIESRSLAAVRNAVRQHMIVSVRNLGLSEAVPPLLRDGTGSVR